MMSSLPSTVPPPSFPIEAPRRSLSFASSLTSSSSSLSPPLAPTTTTAAAAAVAARRSPDSSYSWQAPSSLQTAMPSSSYGDPATRPDQPAPTKSRNTTPPEAKGLKWVTSTKNLAGFKNPEVMKEVRNHVMVDYLHKREKVAEPAPPPLRRANTTQRILPTPTPDSQASSSASRDVMSREQALKIFRNEKRARSQRSPGTDSSDSSRRKRRISSSNESHDNAALDRRSSYLVNIDRYRSVLRKMRAMAPINQPLVFPRIESLAPFPYDSAFKNITPLSFDLGRALDPFRTLPQASTSEVNVEKLKFHCSRFYGTRAMGVRWVPALLKHRHAFLGTLCVASSQLDISSGNGREGKETTLLRLEVVHLVSQSLANSRTQVDDPTIMAVLQLLCSELVRGETKEILWHENGMEQMIRQRGGLQELGVAPDLAVMITTVSLLSSIAREIQPRKIYLDYADNLPKDAFKPSRPIPESPLYCPRDEFLTVVRSNKCKAETFELLCDMKEMIELSVSSGPPVDTESARGRNVASSSNNTPNSISSSKSPQGSRHASPTSRVENRIQSLYAKILLLPSAEDPGHELSGDWTYESCRIAACIHATAIAKRIPISVAANIAALPLASSPSAEEHASQQSSRKDSHTLLPQPPLPHPLNGPPHKSPSTSPTPSETNSEQQPVLLHALRSCLDKSNISNAWMEHHMTGVLLWITLVGSSAATNLAVPTPVPTSPSLERLQQSLVSSSSPAFGRPSSNSPQPARNTSPSSTSSSSSSSYNISAEFPASPPTLEQRLLRKWILGLAIRCCVLLAFEHNSGVLQSLTKMLRVNQRLRGEGISFGPRTEEGIVTFSGPSAVVGPADAGTADKQVAKRRKRKV